MLICDCMCAYENQDALFKIHGFIHLYIAAVQSYVYVAVCVCMCVSVCVCVCMCVCVSLLCAQMYTHIRTYTLYARMQVETINNDHRH